MFEENDSVLRELYQDALTARDRAEARARSFSGRLRLAAANMLRSEDGQEFLFWLINLTGVFAPSFTGNSATFFLEGRRSVGLEVYRLLMEADPGALQAIIDFQRAALAARKKRQGAET
ncbi:MAG: hypothetical protein LBO77_03655 [Desulfovibrio sp.]|nr:hypothetical protein [Desulfovibrio sp.]